MVVCRTWQSNFSNYIDFRFAGAGDPHRPPPVRGDGSSVISFGQREPHSHASAPRVAIVAVERRTGLFLQKLSLVLTAVW